VTVFTKNSNFLNLFISCIIVGSILGMDRGVLIKGFLKIFVPLAARSVAGSIVGTFVGVLLGIGAYHTFFGWAKLARSLMTKPPTRTRIAANGSPMKRRNRT